MIERAALLAEGAEFPAIMAWITDHAGMPEARVATATRKGLHGPRMSSDSGAAQPQPLRYVLPAGTLA